MTVPINPDAGKQADFFESAIAFVLVQKLGNGIVCDEDVYVTIPIKIRDRDS